VNVILVGYRGTGKSTVAEVLGQRLGRRVIGLDQELVRRAGRSIPEIVAAHGWAYFRDLEEEVCRSCAEQLDCVLDCGGGVVERENNFEVLRSAGRVIWLTATVSTIVARIQGDDQRPSLTGAKSFVEEVSEVLERRAPLYRRLCHVEIATDGRSPEAIAAEIQRRLVQ
jgi:shikimate kinase